MKLTLLNDTAVSLNNMWTFPTVPCLAAAFILGLFGSLVAMGCYIPGIYKVLKYNDTRSISLLMFSLTSFGCVVWVIIGILFWIGLGSSNGMVTGLPIILSNFGLGISSLGILIKKLNHTFQAKKHNLSQDEYFLQYCKKTK